ncbi:two-component system sensor histidine kinase/response regulator [Haloarcula taiwanensis]|uniref:histidine kinase n=1 Tax=Haloarcula taiwanensis TaxID=1932004 RepID=A0A2H4ZVQ5_9EURY|nr:ATP-binding protein [Haloarcula taiwanensis]AUG46537.1 two-component system sensor histidine kinase/response regulator [Haloarcula taiwanensis]
MDTPVATPNRHGADGTAGQVRVLYVDEDCDDITAVKETLTDSADEFTVTVCETATDALSALEDASYDCVVSEYRLPARNGIELLGAVRDRSFDLPFLLFTDDGDESVASEAISAGVTDYVTKTPLSEQTELLRQRITAAVARSREESDILDRMTDAFFAVDENWEFTYANERGRRIIERAMKGDGATTDLLGRNIWEVIPSIEGTEFSKRYREAMSNQEPTSFEAYFEPLQTWFEVSVYPSSTGISVYFRDITERQKHEEKLRGRERTLREIYAVISRKDMDFEAKVERLLEIGQHVLGTETAALSRIDGDRYVFEIVTDRTGTTEAGDTVPLEATNCERAVIEEQTLVLADIAEDRPDLAERAGYTEMGISCYLGTPVIVDGSVFGTFCFYGTDPRDSFSEWEVTLVELMGNWVSYEQERERREQELTRERNRLEDFASVVSHDLRNPLSVAFGRLTLVEEEYDGNPEHIESLHRSLERMDELIDDVLALARGGHKVIDANETSLDDIITAAWDTVESSDATLERIETDAEITGDQTRLQQLFENLFRNSVEHSDDPVTVRVGTLSGGRGFYVADDGPGIPEDEREQVFERGYTTSDDGTGFGLAIVSEIVDAHGGRITVAESDGGGVRFDVTGVQVDRL